jgi:limonene-1,2-epoxide hydrolase
MAISNERLIENFCAAWSRRNIDEILAYFSPDAVYHNMPLEPLRGVDEIRATLEMFLVPSESIDFELLALASTGNLVFTERVDRFRIMGRDVVLPVAGVFELHNEKIVAWRDYFDMQTWLRQTGMGEGGS